MHHNVLVLDEDRLPTVIHRILLVMLAAITTELLFFSYAILDTRWKTHE